MGRYDYFVGHLECRHCGAISANDSSTVMQTYLRDPEDPYAPEIYLGAGDALGDIGKQEFTWSYRTIQEPDLGEKIRILQCWLCRSCATGNNWAEIVVRRGAIESVSATPLTRALLERSSKRNAPRRRDRSVRSRDSWSIRCRIGRPRNSDCLRRSPSVGPP